MLRSVPGHAVRGGAMLAADAVVTVGALAGALALRFDGRVPQQYRDAALAAIPLLLLSRLTSNFFARVHGWCFPMAGLADAVRVGLAGIAGTVLFANVSWALARPLPRTVYALEFFLTTTSFGLVRFAPRVVSRWRVEQLRRRAGATRTIVVGANGTGELLARDVMRSPECPYQLVGFVAEDPSMVGWRVDGKPVLGSVSDLPRLIRRHRAAMVLLAIPREPAARIRAILDVCATCRVRFKIVPSSFAELDDRVSAAMLNDLAPEDLLTREAIVFDEAEIRARVRGRRVLVTGAGGSIGGEMCRQLVRYGVSQLVMVDMNENELYLHARRLADAAPGVEVHPEVADVREPDRLGRLGGRFRPQYVFHAAAHKHVPLMEEAPEEAVKNNVLGTLNVVRMATACGAERLVLISTDKAVNPSSVMGATKRVAELVMRDHARRSQTRMTAVRFGNVLGSAGSVVPLFKEQIERGGPVTVTHPGCTRYFMTVPEAVGLVLVAGLGDYGDLCVLDMGEPIRIDELARNMITLSGRVPGVEIPIVYTGLRPGEKLCEELLTEEEEQTQAVRDRIRIARSPIPPPDLEARLEQVAGFAEVGDRAGVLRVLQALVPTFRPGGLVPVAPTSGAPATAPARPAADAQNVDLPARPASAGATA